MTQKRRHSNEEVNERLRKSKGIVLESKAIDISQYTLKISQLEEALRLSKIRAEEILIEKTKEIIALKNFNRESYKELKNLKKIAPSDIDPKERRKKRSKASKTQHNRDVRQSKIYNKRNLHKLSQGEFIIGEELVRKNIRFTSEKEFEDCINPKTNYKLRFDFYLPDYNTCIEYDGQQHFHYVPDFHGDDLQKAKILLKDQQFRDQVKNDYCKAKGIKLIRISYKDFAFIPKVLQNNLNFSS